MLKRRKRLCFEQLEQRQLLAAINIATNLEGAVGALVSVPVTVDTANGIRGATIRVAYDPAVLSLTQENVLLGTAWSRVSDTQLTANVNQGSGTVVVFISSPTELQSNSSTLVNFRFTVQSAATIGARTNVDLVEARLNEGAIVVNPLPQSGADPTDGAITVVSGNPEQPSGTSSISGRVFADSNKDFQPGVREGIPGSMLTLFGTSSGLLQRRTSGSDGGFEFTNLPSGSYRLVQTQPIAYLNGGTNELVFQINANQQLTGQNFRELGLRPQYISNRLITTIVMPIGSAKWIQEVATVSSISEVSSGARSSSPSIGTANLVVSSAAPTELSMSSNGLAGEGEGRVERTMRLRNSNASPIAPTSVPIARRPRYRDAFQMIDEAHSDPTFQSY